MAHELLKRFIVERLLILDPTLSDAPGSPIYRHVVDPLIARIGADPMSTDIESFILARMRDDPTTRSLDLVTEGSTYKDILARAMILLLGPLKREIAHIKTQRRRIGRRRFWRRSLTRSSRTFSSSASLAPTRAASRGCSTAHRAL